MPDFGVADCFYARENQRVMRNSVLLCETIARPFICFIIRVIFLIPMPVVLNRELLVHSDFEILPYELFYIK